MRRGRDRRQTTKSAEAGDRRRADEGRSSPNDSAPGSLAPMAYWRSRIILQFSMQSRHVHPERRLRTREAQEEDGPGTGGTHSAGTKLAAALPRVCMAEGCCLLDGSLATTGWARWGPSRAFPLALFPLLNRVVAARPTDARQPVHVPWTGPFVTAMARVVPEPGLDNRLRTANVLFRASCQDPWMTVPSSTTTQHECLRSRLIRVGLGRRRRKQAVRTCNGVEGRGAGFGGSGMVAYHELPIVLFPFSSARRRNCAALN